MTNLADLQASFQRRLLEGDSAFADRVASPPSGSAERRIAIYADAYRIRLRDALASNFPVLRTLLGETAFVEIADAYIAGRPSTYRSMRWYGNSLPEMLRSLRAHQPWLADLAEWEWALAAAFDSADLAPLAAGALGSIRAEEWPRLRFAFHPSVRALRMHTNAPALFMSLSREERAPVPAAAPETFWLISRRALTPRYREMAASEAAALDSMLRGETFESMCTTLLSYSSDGTTHATALHAAQLLRAWLEEEVVCSVVRDDR